MKRCIGVMSLTVSLFAIACTSTEGSDPATESDELSQRASEYTCKKASPTILEKPELKVIIADGHVRFTDAFGPNTGTRDRSYRAPPGKQRVRYDDFEWGGDCSFKIVMDASMLRGEPTAQMRVQCSNDDEFQQDIYACDSPRATRLNVRPPATPPPASRTVPARNAKKWTCTVSGARVLEDRLTVQVDDTGMRIVADDLEYEGVRDPSYRSRTGSWHEYEDFGYGGDCTMSVIVDPKIKQASTTSAPLKVRCSGDDFHEDSYTCRPE